MRKQELHPRTAVINKAQKNKSKKARTDALLWLAANFPAAFDNSLRIRPLKIGIMDDILLHAEKAAEVGISKSKLREAVVLFTRRLDYLACLKLREMRIDLQGNDVGEVSSEEAEYAAAKIKKRVEKSARNARKALADKTANPSNPNPQGMSYHSKIMNQSSNTTDDNFPVYPTRSTYNALNATTQPVRTTAVVVKHKSAKQYDPDAVARLKEKLGLSRNSEEKKETVEE
ncbi:ProQ/FinO family protein [Legionella longbeachae]|uniref:Putative N-terminal part of ProQ, activator of ProP osmoprotectant transporter (Truncated?) n=1 Tax=Legionella longbeachae serogroup 1 (strain NSW150) TaxID=661367 RepID=D3HMN1_LEGLN|nr:ProQ/FinO family protein [Legionella longbeachae]VEE04232.1 ProQ [Legionella oakridgensis]HBD7397002.1 ProQ/FinO family protein [Legionella pneumophila]ARB92940.1 activator of prop osmoprotectant transporter [Legionella longbeachae]ARM33920.1 activator of prop osmoprotectant transporter [Legionella longbeachae]EEZ96878.1 putative ProQ activator of osmoprotectant transporter ProP [Legionella longbeachae D-4968]